MKTLHITLGINSLLNIIKVIILSIHVEHNAGIYHRLVSSVMDSKLEYPERFVICNRCF